MKRPICLQQGGQFLIQTPSHLCIISWGLPILYISNAIITWHLKLSSFQQHEKQQTHTQRDIINFGNTSSWRKEWLLRLTVSVTLSLCRGLFTFSDLSVREPPSHSVKRLPSRGTLKWTKCSATPISSRISLNPWPSGRPVCRRKSFPN